MASEDLKELVLNILKENIQIELDTVSDYYGNYDLKVKLLYVDNDKKVVIDEASTWIYRD
jgi:hypothetical protein